MIDLILLAAGLGTRTGLGYPKQFLRLAGKPILIHTLEVFAQVPEIDKIIIAIKPEFENHYKKLIEDYKIPRVVLIGGGETRQESVKNCLPKVTTKRVIIHEAARPFVTPDFITLLLMYQKDIVVPVLPITFATLLNDSCRIEPLDKRKVMNIQLPQVFNYDIIYQAHQRAKKIYDDDSMLVWEESEKTPDIALIPGLEENIKITTPLDLKLAEVIYDERFSHSHGG